MEDAAGRELLSALDDRDPTVIRAAMVSYADRVQGVRLQAKAYDLVAWQHGQSSPLTVPQLGSCDSSGRAWRLWAARHSQKEANPLGARPLPRVRSSPPPKSPTTPPLTI
jgi:hypothetical protein